MNLILKSIIIGLVIISSFVIFSSCNDEELGGMEWTISNSNPEDITVQNDGDAQISITVGTKGGEVVLTCSNYNNLKFHLWNDKEETYYESNIGTFSVTTNKVKCTFPEQTSNDEYDGELYKISAKSGDKTVNTVLQVNRTPATAQ